MDAIRRFFGFVTGLIVGAYKLVMGLIGLLMVGLVIFAFFYIQWNNYQEDQYEERRGELYAAASDAARERGLGNPDRLRQDYIAACPLTDEDVVEGDRSEICATIADTLLERSQELGMSLFDHLELRWDLCSLDARQEGGDPEDECDRDYMQTEAWAEAMGQALCRLDSAWVIHPGYGGNVTRRGPHVYADHSLYVNCQTGLIEEYDYYGFFDGLDDDYEEEYLPVVEQLYNALWPDDGEADVDQALALLDTHEFGVDERSDQVILNQFLEDDFATLVPEVLKRNGGKVNFDADYYDQPLSIAIYEENTALALLLLESGADPVRPHEYGVTPIVNAAGSGMLEVVKELVARGADVDGVIGSETRNFGDPLEFAAQYGHEETVFWLLENGARIAPEDPSRYPEWDAEWFLSDATAGGDLAVVQALVAKVAKSDDPVRLFEKATEGANPEILLFLFEQGYELPDAKYHDRIYSEVVNAVKEEDNRRIEDGVRLFDVLLDHGLDMSEVSDSGWHYGHQAVRSYAPSPLIPHLEESRYPVVNALRLEFVKRVIDEVLASGIGIDDRFEGETMLMTAADHAKSGVLRHLLDRGADPSLRNDAGRTALEIAASEGRRLMSYRPEDTVLRQRYTEAVEILGGSGEMLQPVPESDR